MRPRSDYVRHCNLFLYFYISLQIKFERDNFYVIYMFTHVVYRASVYECNTIMHLIASVTRDNNSF